ncbi:uncharacterized protein LOC124914438 isoform X2 [Impatiens glandulifera]|uniref:uncharacterized protein LOC124914438 isoform X2 n=1 Tax=Impatiens glandulifera TaxID=253017 RepID=UPI001FB05428|nr:uncharacterized protein LOC124914438 isoform X2 [Impatiens glandulifera]
MHVKWTETHTQTSSFHFGSVLFFFFFMESPKNMKLSLKPAKGSGGGGMIMSSPTSHYLSIKNHYSPPQDHDHLKERQNYDKNKACFKLFAKNTRPQEFTLHTQERAFKRAVYNYTMATKVYLIEQQKRQVERVQKMIEEEEIRMMRKEMIPRAQLMPIFDRPFFPQRSTRPLTIPKEPGLQRKASSCISCS